MSSEVENPDTQHNTTQDLISNLPENIREQLIKEQLIQERLIQERVKEQMIQVVVEVFQREKETLRKQSEEREKEMIKFQEEIKQKRESSKSDLPENIREQLKQLIQEIYQEVKSKPEKAEIIIKLISSYLDQELDHDLEQEELNHEEEDKAPIIHQVLKLSGGGGGNEGLIHLLSLIWRMNCGEDLKFLLNTLIQYLLNEEDETEQATNRIETFLNFIIYFNQERGDYLYLLYPLLKRLSEDVNFIDYILSFVRVILENEEKNINEDDYIKENSNNQNSDEEEEEKPEIEKDLYEHLANLHDYFPGLGELLEHFALLVESPDGYTEYDLIFWIKSFIELMMNSQDPDSIFELFSILENSLSDNSSDFNERLFKFIEHLLNYPQDLLEEFFNQDEHPNLLDDWNHYRSEQKKKRDETPKEPKISENQEISEEEPKISENQEISEKEPQINENQPLNDDSA